MAKELMGNIGWGDLGAELLGDDVGLAEILGDDLGLAEILGDDVGDEDLGDDESGRWMLVGNSARLIGNDVGNSARLIGHDVGAAPKRAPKAKGATPAKVADVPPPIPGEPVDVVVATAAAAHTMGIPPMVAASTIAAGKSGDKSAQKELLAAKKVYVAASRGDPIARNQMAQVKADTKGGYAPAAQKAAFLAGAIGMTKGWITFRKRTAHAPRQRMTPPPAQSLFIQFGRSVYRPYAYAIHKRTSSLA